MTEMSQNIIEYSVLGCKVRVSPDRPDSHNAKLVVDKVNTEINQLKSSRPLLKDTDVAVLVALQMATEKLQLEEEYKRNILKLEESLEAALQALNVEVE